VKKTVLRNQGKKKRKFLFGDLKILSTGGGEAVSLPWWKRQEAGFGRGRETIIGGHQRE
jgi:hypothetical protein